MFRRLREWWWRVRRTRALFWYWDGARWKFADPAALWRAMLNHPQLDFANDLQEASCGIEPKATETWKIIAGLLGVERMAETGRGLTDWEIHDIVRQFEEYLELLKKSTSPLRMPLQLLALGFSTLPDSPDAATSAPLGSASTPDASDSAEPITSEPPSETP